MTDYCVVQLFVVLLAVSHGLFNVVWFYKVDFIVLTQIYFLDVVSMKAAAIYLPRMLPIQIGSPMPHATMIWLCKLEVI